MSIDNAAGGERTLFSAVLTPHRSLGEGGFLLVMAIVGGVSFAAGLLFVLLGAWPVMGFFGLDVLLIYWAFRANYRSAQAYEEVTVTPSSLTVRKITHRGETREWLMNPLWVRLERHVIEGFGLQRLALVSHGRELTVAGFLGPDERESFARALADALGEARRGPTRSILK